MATEHTTEHTTEDAAIERFDQTAWESTWCAAQDSFETFTLAARNNLKAELTELLPDLAKRPFKAIHMVQLVIGFGAPREGARGFASLRTDTPPPSSKQIDYDRLWANVSAANDPSSERTAAIKHQLATQPHMDAVLTYAVGTLHANLIEKAPFLEPHAERIRQMLFVNLLYGVKMEFLFPIIAKEVASERTVMQRWLAGAEAADPNERAAIDRLKQQYDITDDNPPGPAPD